MTDTQDPSTAAAAPPAPLFKKRGAKAQTNLRKKRAATPPSASSGASSDSEFSSDETTHIKRRKKNAGVVSASSAARSATTPNDPPSTSTSTTTSTRTGPPILPDTNDATKQSNWYDETDPTSNAANLLGKTRHPQSSSLPQEPDGTYKGLAHQTQQTFIKRNPDAPTKKAVGPVRAPTNVRMTTFTDYAPDVCKDYKLTGWCGFGDNCKFLHDRSDYKAGWELDKEWETVTKGKKVAGTVVSDRARGGGGAPGERDMDDEDAELEDIPFACIICQRPYTEPIVTKCGHYFCEACALKRYRKDPSCAACGAATNGVFNSSKKLKRLLERKAEKQAQRRREAEENGEVLSEDEEDEDEDE